MSGYDILTHHANCDSLTCNKTGKNVICCKYEDKACEKMKISVRMLIIAVTLSVTFMVLCGISSCKNTISGTVKGDGAHDVIMELSGDASFSTKTSVNGKYSFKGLERGSYTITPVKDGYLFFPKSRDVKVEEDKVGIDFASGAGMDSISGASIKPF